MPVSAVSVKSKVATVRSTRPMDGNKDSGYTERFLLLTAVVMQ